MAWSGSAFTRVYGTTGWQDDAALGTGIVADRHDTQDNDLATGINACINKNGANTPTANLSMGGFKHTNVANASASNEYVAKGQLEDGSLSVDVADLTVSTGPSSLVGGVRSYATNQEQMIGYQFSANTNGAAVYLAKSRGAAVGTYTVPNNGDTYGEINFCGVGTGSPSLTGIAGKIAVVADATPSSTTDMPGALIVSTTPDGSGTPVERIRVRSTGTVAVNTSQSPVGQFDIESSTSGRRAMTLYNTVAGNASTPVLGIIKTDTTTTTSQIFAQFWTNAGSSGSGAIAANGVNQATFVSTCDERLKENVTELTPQLSNLLALRPVEFDYKDGSGHQIGFIAQEVQAVYPDVIGQNEDGYLTIAGWSKTESRIVKAIQEMHAKLEALEARLAELEG